MASLQTWAGDESQQFALDVQFAASLTAVAAVADPPAALDPTDYMIHRYSPVMPPIPSLDDMGRPEMPWEPTSDTVRAPWGRWQLVTGGRDVTFFRGVPFELVEKGDQEPFGDDRLIIRFPQFTPFEHVGSGAWSWLEKGRNIELKRVRADTGTTVVKWSGSVLSTEGHVQSDGKTYYLEVHCRGALFYNDYGCKQPSYDYRERDRGGVIAEAFNLYAGANHGKCIPVVTGITTRARGAWEKVTSGFVQDQLAEMTTSDGLSQWTVAQEHRTPVIRLKDTTTIHFTLTTGTEGVEIGLVSDLSDGENVIYGEGIDPSGLRWGNTKYPRLRPGSLPVFPGTDYTPGSSTAGFDALADELRRNGYPDLYSADTYDSRDEDEVKDAQRRAGVTADGIVDGSTWTALFQLGSNIGDLRGAHRAPLWSDTRVERYLYNAQGAKIGNNPDFDPSIPRRERFINFGEGITLARAKTIARSMGARDADVGQAGTITLTVDPEEMSRHDIRSGMNGRLIGWQGIDRTVHVARTSLGGTEDELPVTLTVDTKNRDLATLVAIHERNKAAADDPVLRQLPQKRSDRIRYANRFMWDDAAGAGQTGRFAATAGEYTVVQVPAAQRGDIVRVHAVTDTAATRYALLVFGRKVTHAAIHAKLANPLAVTDWTDFSDGLIDLGILNGWGTHDQACGYGNHYQSQTGATVNGVFEDGMSWPYESFQPPWLWVAIFPIADCFASVHLYAAAET